MLNTEVTRRSLWSWLLAPFAGFGAKPVQQERPVLKRLPKKGPPYLIEFDEYECPVHGNIGITLMTLTANKKSRTVCMECVIDLLAKSGVACLEEETKTSDLTRA